MHSPNVDGLSIFIFSVRFYDTRMYVEFVLTERWEFSEEQSNEEKNALDVRKLSIFFLPTSSMSQQMTMSLVNVK